MTTGPAGLDPMQKPLIEPWTVDDFLAWERAQDERYEFVDGIVRMMVGGTLAHARIKGNVYSALRARLSGGSCEVFVDGPKVVTATESMYPDVVVTGVADLASDADAVPEPVLILEVLARSTEHFHRGGQWRAHQELASLRHFILVAQHERRVEAYRRTRSGWALTVHARPEDRVALPPCARPYLSRRFTRALYRDGPSGVQRCCSRRSKAARVSSLTWCSMPSASIRARSSLTPIALRKSSTS